jgi:hypothetical protein
VALPGASGARRGVSKLLGQHKKDRLMSKERDARGKLRFLVSRVAHVVERLGLAMSGAMGGTFIAAYLARSDTGPFDSLGFGASMILVGIVGFYLGIDIPARRADRLGFDSMRGGLDAVELLSATGTFLAAAAALIAVYAIVLDDVPQRTGEFVISGWWLLGGVLQTGAGAIGRLRPEWRIANSE